MTLFSFENAAAPTPERDEDSYGRGACARRYMSAPGISIAATIALFLLHVAANSKEIPERCS